jgi:hypothetical protein
MQTRDFWTERGSEHVIPKGFGESPEGFDVVDVIKNLADEVGYKSVIDFGCGYGRLCQSFDPTKYMGIDVNPNLVDEAKKRFQNYNFSLCNGEVMGAELYLAHKVFMHMTDKEIHEALSRFRMKWIIVSEILGKEWRREGEPPQLNRDLNDYIQIFRSHDLVLHKHVRKPYKRYEEIPWYQGKNTDISFLVFRKCLKNPLYN